MADIPIPAARVRQLSTLCHILSVLYSAYALGNYSLMCQILAIRDIDAQAYDASNYLAGLTAAPSNPKTEG